MVCDLLVVYMIQRITPCSALSQSYTVFAYRGANAPLLCSYCGVSKSQQTTFVQAHVVCDLFGCLLMILRITPCFALSQSFTTFAYRGANAPLLCSYCGGSKSQQTTFVQAHVVCDLLTLES